MEKPKRSFLIYLISVYFFLMCNISLSPLLKKSIANNEISGLVSSIIWMLSIVLAIIFIVYVIKYNKFAFFIGAGILFINTLYGLYLILFVYKKFISLFDILIILNIAIIYFLLNKKNLQKCNDFSEYYKERKEQKNNIKRLK